MGWLSSFVSNPIGTTLDTANKAIDTAGNIGQKAVDVVKDHPLEAAALGAAGYYFYPEISAWMNPTTGEAVAGTAAGAAAGATTANIGAGALGATAAGALGANAASSLGSVLSNYALPAAITASALTGANAAKEAAATQAAASDRANALAEKIYGEQKALQTPYREAGITAQNRLMTLLGLAPTTTTTASSHGGLLGKIENLFGGGNTTTSTAGGDVNNPDFGKYAKDFSMTDFQADPGYQFRLSEGLKSLDRQAAMRGGLISGGALKATQDYGQQAASQEYTNAFNRYQTNRANQLQPLGNLISTGQSAAANTGAAAGNYGSTAGSNITSAGAAQAAGQVGSTNALTSGLNQYLNYSSSQDLLNAIRQSAYKA